MPQIVAVRRQIAARCAVSLKSMRQSRSPVRSHSAFATGAEPAKDLQVDSAACTAAAAAGDDDKIISACGELIENDKTARADRIKALIARGAALDRKDRPSEAIDDYDTVLRLDPGLADVFNIARRALAQARQPSQGAGRFRRWRSSSTRSIAAARANYKSLARELERLGALIAVAGKPSFYCKTARRAVEKAICANQRACRSRSRDPCDECQGHQRRQEYR